MRDRLARLLEDDESFRELCEGYEDCAEVLARPSLSEGLRLECEALRRRFEAELLGYLRDVKSAHESAGGEE